MKVLVALAGDGSSCSVFYEDSGAKFGTYPVKAGEVDLTCYDDAEYTHGFMMQGSKVPYWMEESSFRALIREMYETWLSRYILDSRYVLGRREYSIPYDRYVRGASHVHNLDASKLRVGNVSKATKTTYYEDN